MHEADLLLFHIHSLLDCQVPSCQLATFARLCSDPFIFGTLLTAMSSLFSFIGGNKAALIRD